MTTKTTCEFKGGRHRPENAKAYGVAQRGFCAICGRPKAAHF